MYRHTCSKQREFAGVARLCRLSIPLGIIPILLLFPLLSITPAWAQGHEHYGGVSAHSFPPESVEPVLTPAQLWSRIHNSHLGLLGAVPRMSKRDVEYYLKALKSDLNTLSDHPRILDSKARTSLDDATKRLNQLGKTLKNAMKSGDSTSASVQLAQLNHELDEIGRFFPANALPKADGLRLNTPSPRPSEGSQEPASSLRPALASLSLSQVPPRTLTARSSVVSSPSPVADTSLSETCPMHSELKNSGSACCNATDGTPRD